MTTINRFCMICYHLGIAYYRFHDPQVAEVEALRYFSKAIWKWKVKNAQFRSVRTYALYNGLPPFNDRVRQHIGTPFFGHKLPAARARELFKPSTDSAYLLVDIEKKYFSFWVWVFLGGTSQVGVFLCYFGHLCLALGAVPMGHFLDSMFSWKLRQNPHL